MDWCHDLKVDQTLDRLSTYVDAGTRATLLKLLVDEQSHLGTHPVQLEKAVRRVWEGRERITRVLIIIEGLLEHGLMDRHKLSRALSVVDTMCEAQRLVEQRLSDSEC